MILFAGVPSERPLALAIASAERQGLPHVVMNQRRWRFCDLEISVTGGRARGALWLDERRWPLEAFSGIYCRSVDPAAAPENHPRAGAGADARQLARSAFFYALWNDWLEIAPGRVVNRPGAMASNVSKPYQAQLIAACGFLTPPTLVASDPEAVQDFHERHGRIVYKSVSSVRSIVKEWRPGQGGLERLRALPTQFQAYIGGMNVRVHVIGGEAFATAIQSQCVDYRYAARDGATAELSAYELPEDVAQKCCALTARLGLSFSGIDLKRSDEGAWYCFEVNTSPGYSYFQEETGQPISDALVAYLAHAERRPAVAGGGDDPGVNASPVFGARAGDDNGAGGGESGTARRPACGDRGRREPAGA